MIFPGLPEANTLKRFKNINRLKKFSSNKQLVGILLNTTWLLVDKVIRMGAGMLVGVWVARYLGPENFGTLNYVIAFASFFGIISGFGLDAIVVRELVKEPDKESLILGNACLIKFVSALVSLSVVILIVLLYPQTPLINLSIVIITFGFIFQCFDVIDFYYQAKVLSKRTVIAKNISFLMVSLIKIFLILKGYDLIAFVYIASIEVILSSFFLGISFYLHKRSKIKWKLDFKYSVFLIKQGFPLVLSGFVIVMYMRIDQIMLGNILGQQAVGYYSAAIKITELWYFIPTIICSSILPSMINAKLIDDLKYENLFKKLYITLNLLSISIAIPITFLSYTFIELIYGSEYILSAGVLSISIWAAVFAFLSVGTGQYLIIENFTRIAFYRNLISSLMNIILNLLLIPLYGINGAAWATLSSYFFSVFSLALFKSTRQHFLLVLRSFLFYSSSRLHKYD